jgi:Asp-tRNA(Asn)/Glu-tRNA(Gln) amidotransferase C subunit
MKDMVRRLDAEYKFGLSEEEIEIIAKQAESAEKLFKPLFDVDLTGIMPLMKVDRRPRPEPRKKKAKR